jgi:SAM-dependent methyltransferase
MAQTDQHLYAIDTPGKTAINRLTRVSGWFITHDDKIADQIRILINGCPIASATRCIRFDVAEAFPHLPNAVRAGFYGDVIIPDSLCRQSVELSLEFYIEGTWSKISTGHYNVTPGSIDEGSRNRERIFILEDLLSNDAQDIRSKIEFNGSRFENIEGVPHFHPSDAYPLIRLCETAVTHPYPSKTLELIDELGPAELYLDLGSGIRPPESRFANGVLLDAVHFPTVDIVSTLARLPFADNIFQLVVSHAVFEHVRDPMAMAAEIFRVLKPGGLAYIETAFMQPFHGDPDHFYNMTLPGLKHTFREFEICDQFVAKHQSPSNSLIMQIDAISPFINRAPWKDTLSHLVSELHKNGAALDSELGIVGGEILAAGVAVLARKPKQA